MEFRDIFTMRVGLWFIVETIRAFIAIALPPFAIEKIATVQRQFKSLNLDAAWVRPDNIHLTLRFLGNIIPDQISEIKSRMTETVSGICKFEIFLSRVGVFPNLNRPKALWIGLENPDNSLERLQKKVAEQTRTLGFKPELKKFVPHLTLARIRSPKGKESLKREVQSNRVVRAGAIEVSSIKLYESQLTPKGSIYNVLKNFELS